MQITLIIIFILKSMFKSFAALDNLIDKSICLYAAQKRMRCSNCCFFLSQPFHDKKSRPKKRFSIKISLYLWFWYISKRERTFMCIHEDYVLSIVPHPDNSQLCLTIVMYLNTIRSKILSKNQTFPSNQTFRLHIFL